MATKDDVLQNQSAFAEKVEKEDRELLTTTSGTVVEKLFQVDEKKLQTVTEPYEEFIAGNLGSRDGENVLESPILFEIAGEEISSSSQVYKGKDMTMEDHGAKSETNLVAEEDLQYQEVEVTINEETVMDFQEATSAKTTGATDHVPELTQDINLDIAKFFVTGTQDAVQQNTLNTSTVSFEDLHKEGLPIKEEKGRAISSILDSKMEPQGPSSSLNTEDETPEKVQRSSDSTRNFTIEEECKSDHTEVAKENSQDVEVLTHSAKVGVESTKKIENLSNLLKIVSSEAEYGSSHSEATGKNSQDADVLPESVILGHETTKEVESLSEYTGNVAIETECSKKHGEKTKGNPQDLERLLDSVNMEDEKKKIQISSDLDENVSIEIENGTDDGEVIEGTSEDVKIMPHSVILEHETTEKAESSSEHTRMVSAEAEYESGHSKVTKENVQDAEILSHSFEVEDQKIEKAGNSSTLARNVSMETCGESKYIEATEEEISENVEIQPSNSAITPSITSTSTSEAEPGETSCNVKSIDDGSANVRFSSAADCPNKHEKEDKENGSRAEQVSSTLVNVFAEEILLKDVGPQKVQELEEHSGTIFEKEDGVAEDIEPAPVKEISDMVPIAAKKKRAEVENPNNFLEEVVSVRSTDSAVDKAEERLESSSNDVVMKKEETLKGKSQEQALVELLAGEDTQDEVSKVATEANIDVEVPVKPEIFNTEKDLEDMLPRNEPGKESLYEFLQAASMPLEKIDSSVQEQRSIACLEGALSEEKDITSNASKSKAKGCLQENAKIEGSNKEVDSAILNDTAQETYKIGQCPESTILEGLSTVEESSLELRSTTETEGDKYGKNILIDREDKMQEKDEVPSGKEENFAPQSCTNNERKLVEGLSVENNKTKCPKGEADSINDYEEIRGNASEEAASELKEDQPVVEEVQKDTFSKDEEREIEIITKEQVVTGNSVESSAAEKNKSNHKAANPEAYDVHKGEAIFSNDDEEIKGRDMDEGLPELKEHQIVAKEACMETLSNGEEKETQTIDKEAANPEDGNKGEAFCSNDNEEIKGHDSEEEAPEVNEHHTVAEEAHKDTFGKDEGKETQIIDKEEVATEYFVESSIAGNKSGHEVKTEATKDIFSKNEEKETQTTDKVEETTEYLVEVSVAEKDKSDHKAIKPEADVVCKAEAVYSNDDEKIKGNDSAGGALELREDQISAEQAGRDSFSKDDEKETQTTGNEQAVSESVEPFVAKEKQYNHELTSEVTNPEADEVHKGKAVQLNDNKEIAGNYSEEVAPEPKEDQIAIEEVYKDTFSKDEEKEKQMIDKEGVATEYLVESSATKEKKSNHKLKTEATNLEADDVHKQAAFCSNGNEEIRGTDSKEEAHEVKEDQIITEEAHMDTFSKDEEKGPQIVDTEVAATECLAESSVADENKSDHEVKAEETNPEAEELHKGKADHHNDDEEIKGNYSEDGSPESNEDQIAAEVHKETFSKDEEKETQIIDQEKVAAEYLVEFSVAEDSKSDHDVATEATSLEAADVHKRKTVCRNDDEDIKGTDTEKEAPELKEDQILAEEACKDTFSKDEEKDTQIIDKEMAATEYLAESSVAEENKSDHKITTEETNPKGAELHKGTADLINDDEEVKGNGPEEVSQEPKGDQIVAEEAQKYTFSKHEEKETEIIDKEEVATEYLLESSIACKSKSDCEVKTKEINPEADDVHKEVVYSNNDEEIKGIDSEEGAPELKEHQILTRQTHKDTFSKDKEKDTQIIDKEEVAIEYLAESTVAEERKSNHMDEAQVTDPEGDELHKGKTDHSNDDEVLEGNDQEEVARESNEDQIAEAEVYERIFNTEAEKETQIIDKEKIVAECLVESSVTEKVKFDHKVKIEGTSQEGGDVHNSGENIDAVEDKKTQNESQEAVFECIIAEDNSMTWVTGQEKTEDKFGTGHYFATSSTEEMKVDSCEENQKAKLNKEKIPQSQETEKQIFKETDSSNDCYIKSSEEEIVQESLREDEASKQKSADTQMNIEEILSLAIPISRQGDRSVEQSLKNEDWDVIGPEKEKKHVDIEGTTQNDKATSTAQVGEKETVTHERNAVAADDTAVTVRLAEGLTPSEHQEQVENSSAVPEISKNSKEKMLDTMESAERSVGESLKQEEWDTLETEKETQDVDIEGTTCNDEATQSAREGEMENVKHEGNADIPGDTAGIIIVAEGLPPREHQEQAEIANAAAETSEQSKKKILDTKAWTEIISAEGCSKQEEWDAKEPEKETKDLDREGTTQNDQATLSAQEGEKEMGKQEGNPDAAGTNELIEELPLRECQELAENSRRVPSISEESNDKMLDIIESTEIRPVEGTLKQDELVAMEQEKETKDLHLEGTTWSDEDTHTAREGEMEMVEHEGNPDAAGTNRLAKGLPPRECQELAVPEIFEERNETVLDATESKEIQLVEGSSKQEEWQVNEPEKETKDLDREDTKQNDQATLSAQQNEKETVMHEGNPDAVGSDGLTEELPPREYQELAENSTVVPDISKERNDKMPDTTESTEIRKVEQEEQVVMKQEKETKDLPREGKAQNDGATHTAQEGEKETVKHEENPDAAGTNALTERLPPREYQELAENSSAVRDISEEINETMLDATQLKEVKQLEGSSKQEEWDAKKAENEPKDLDREKGKATLSAQEDEKETVKHERNDVAGINRSTEGLSPIEYQEIVKTSSAMTAMSEERNEKMIETVESTDLRPVEGTLKQQEWFDMEQEKESKNLHIEGTTQNNETTHTAMECEREMVKHEENANAAGTNKLAEELLPQEYQEQDENSSAVPKISEKMLDTVEQPAIRSVEGSLKQEEQNVLEPEKEINDVDIKGKVQSDEATDYVPDFEMRIIKYEENAGVAGDTAGTVRLVEGLSPRDYQEEAKIYNTAPKTSQQSKEKMLDTKVSTEIRSVEGNMKLEEWDVMEPEKKKDLDREVTTENDEATLPAQEGEKEAVKHEENPDVAGTNRLTEELLPEENQELAECTSAVPNVSGKILDAIESNIKTKDLHIEGTTQNGEATTRTAQKGEKEMVKHEENPNAAGMDGLIEGLPPREYQEIAEINSAVPDISEERNETMLDPTKLEEIKLVEGSSKQDKWDVREPEKETKDLHREGTTQKHEAALSAQKGEKKIVEHGRNPEAIGSNRLTEGLPPTDYQEHAENSNAMNEISEEGHEKMLQTPELIEVKPLEGGLKQEEWDVMEPEKETKDLHVEGTTKSNEATQSAQEGENKTVKNESNANAKGTNRLEKELPPREYKKFAENSGAVPEISEKGKEKMLDTMEQPAIRSVEGSLKQEEWDVMEPEKETKDLDKEGKTQKDKATDLDKEGTTQKDKATLSATEGGKETAKHEGNEDAAGTDRLTKGLPPKEYLELAENSSEVPNISEERNEKMLDNTEPREIKPVEGSPKQQEWDAMEPEKKTRDLDREGTIKNDEATLSTWKGEKEIVKHDYAAGTNILIEGLPSREYQELVENPSAAPNISKERNEKMLDTTESKEIKLVEGSSKQEEWHVMEPEKETKELDREGKIQHDEATLLAEEGEKEMVKHEGNPDAAGTDRRTEGLPPRECKELPENSNAAPNISGEGNQKMLDTMESIEIIPVEGISKQEEWDVMEPEKKEKDLHIDGTTQNDEATDSTWESETEIVKLEGNANATGTNILAEELPPSKDQKPFGTSSTVHEISEKDKEKMLHNMESKEMGPVEGSLKQKTKDLDREGKPQNDEATHSAQDVVGDGILIELLPPREYHELAESSSVVPNVSEDRNEKMFNITESTEIGPIEGSLKQDERDLLEPEKETKDVDIEGTTLNDTHSALEGETNTVKHEGNADVEACTAGIVRLAEGLPQRENKDLAENSSAVPEVSEKIDKKMLDTMESTEIAVTGDTKEVNLEDNMQLDNSTPTPEKAVQEDVLKPELQLRSKMVEIFEFINSSNKSAEMPNEENTTEEPCQDSVLEEKAARNVKETIRISDIQEEDGNSHSRNMDTEVKILTELVDSFKVPSPEINKDNHAQENIVRKDSEVNSISTSTAPLVDNITAGESPKELREFMVSEDKPRQAVDETNEDHKKNEGVAKINTMETTEQIHLAIETESAGVKATAQGRSSADEEKQQKVEQQVQFSTINEKKLYGKDILARKCENEDKTFHNEEQNYDDHQLELEPTINELEVEKEELQKAFASFVVPEAREHAAEDVKSLDECKGTPESKIEGVPTREILLKAKASASQDPFSESYIETTSDLESQAKTDHITNTGTKPSGEDEKSQLLQQGPVDKFLRTAIEMLESSGALNTVEGAKRGDFWENVEIIDDSQSTAEKFGSTILAESSKSNRQQQQDLHHSSDINDSALVIETQDAPFCDASANDGVPLEMEKLEAVPSSALEKGTPEEADTNNTSTDSKNTLQLQQEAIGESCQAAGDTSEPLTVKSEEEPHWEEKRASEEATFTSKPRETSSSSLSDLLQASKEDISQVANDFIAETEPNVQMEEMKDIKKEIAQHEEPKTDEEGEGDEEKRKESAYESPVTVEAPSDTDIKAAHKKSHNILSGVGSKVKRSIAKVKKAITGKSSHPKPPLPK